MFDVTIERPTGTGDADEKKLVTIENAVGLKNVPAIGKAIVEKDDEDNEKVPCATVVAVTPTEED